MSDVTVILCGYRRFYHLDEQLEAIKSQTIKPKEIWLWHNHYEESPHKFPKEVEYPDDLDVVVYSSRNFKFIGRWGLAMFSRSKYIAMFDDDTIPGPKYIEHILKCMKTHPGLYVGVGITSFPGKRRIGWVNSHPRIERVDFGGHSWILEKDLAHWFWREPPYNWGNGEDIHLSYMLQKYAKTNTYVSPHPREDKSVWSSLKGNRYGGDPRAHCLFNKKTHYVERNEIIKHYVSKGWKVYPYK